MSRLVTAPLAASRYPSARGSRLTHLVQLDARGVPSAIHCRAASPASVLDDSTTYTNDRPTCPRCGHEWDRLHSGGSTR